MFYNENVLNGISFAIIVFNRCVLSTLEVLKTPYEFKEVDLFKGENK